MAVAFRRLPRTVRRAKRWTVPVFALPLLLAGCARDTIAAPPREVDVVTTSTPAGEQAALGLVVFELSMALVAGGSRLPVGEARAEGIVLLDGSDTVRVLTAAVPDRTYSTVRLVFRSVTAQVDGGLVIGGTPVTGALDVVPSSGDSIVVERPLTPPPAPAPLRILVDLRAREWITKADPDARTVAAPDFAATVRVGTW